MNIDETIKPFRWVEYQSGASVVLVALDILQDVFDTRVDEGFQGSGYDWASLAQIYLQEKSPHLEDKIKFDPEADMFCVYSKDMAALKEFVIGFKAACGNKPLIRDLFSRAELD